MTTKVADGMGVLKAIVAVLGVMILIMVGLIVWAVLRGRPSLPAEAVKIELPAGSVIVDQSLSGERALLRVRAADGRERLVLVELATGRAVLSADVVEGQR
jgi:hypothetical protein